MGPSAFRVAEVDQTIRALGCDVESAGDVQVCGVELIESILGKKIL